MPRRSPPIPSLTGVRGIAALWVFFHHLTMVSGPRLLHLEAIQGNKLLERGWSAVDLFFVLSGFVLMYAHGEEWRTPDSTVLIRFAKLRFMRIFPLSWVVLLATVVVAVASPQWMAYLRKETLADDPVQAFIRTFLLGDCWLPGAGNWVVTTWSLSSEIVGYAAFPILAFLLIRTSNLFVSLLVTATAMVLLAAYQERTGVAGLNDFGPTGGLVRMAGCFVAGMALTRAHALSPAWLARLAPAMSVAAVAGTVVCSLSWHASVLQPACYTVLIFALAFGRGPIDALFKSRPAVFLGTISFPLYLIHFGFFSFITATTAPLPPNSLVGYGIAGAVLVATIGLSWLLHVFVERPTHRLAREWVRSDEAWPAGIVGSAEA